MIKILFLIHDLGQGGAEKVLVNLVNNMDRSKFDISVTALFGGGVNEPFLKPDIHFNSIFPKEFPGNSRLMKLLTPKQLHKLCVKEHYDIEVSYLEGPSARIISGCTDEKTRLVSWIHTQHKTEKNLAASFRSLEEARHCYAQFDRTISVSQLVQNDFCALTGQKEHCQILYNTVESERILDLSNLSAPGLDQNDHIRLIAVGSLKEVKGFDRLLRIINRLVRESYPIHLYILGIGPLQSSFEHYISANHLESHVTLLGYDSNPYRYVAKCDLFICSSHTEGFSTAATEALIVGTPVCTVEVSGMKKMLGENNEYGLVTENSEDALYHGIKKLLDSPELLKDYKQRAALRGTRFSMKKTVSEVEDMLLALRGKEH